MGKESRVGMDGWSIVSQRKGKKKENERRLVRNGMREGSGIR